jgi:hypothetical protein
VTNRPLGTDIRTHVEMNKQPELPGKKVLLKLFQRARFGSGRANAHAKRQKRDPAH